MAGEGRDQALVLDLFVDIADEGTAGHVVNQHKVKSMELLFERHAE